MVSLSHVTRYEVTLESAGTLHSREMSVCCVDTASMTG